MRRRAVWVKQMTKVVLLALLLFVSACADIPQRVVIATSQPASEILVDSKGGVPRTIKSGEPFVVLPEDFGSDGLLRLIFQAPGFARQARFVNKSILEGNDAAPIELSVTELYREQILIKYKSYPPDATLSLEEISGRGMHPIYLGTYPQLTVADRYDLSQGKFLKVNLLLQREGYKPWRKEMPLNNLAKPGEDTADLGYIELTPLQGWSNRWEQIKVLHQFRTPTAVFIDVLLVLMILSVPAVFFPRYRRYRRQKELWKRKEMLESVITDTDPLLKKVLGGYYLTARIGRGGMSKVYRGLPESTLDLEDAVAVKVIDEELATSEEYRARFRREVEVSASLNNPNTVKLIDWGENGSVLFMVQELIEGQTLKEALKNPLSQARFVHIFIPILRALKAAHAKGVIHRDLKPSNVMITPNDVVKLMDFGLAKANKPGHDLTRTGDAFGTPIYMSPEQISGGALDPSADMYSLGVMSFELLTGRLPFDTGEDPMSVMLAHLQQEPHRVSEFRPDIAPELDEMVASLLIKDPAERLSDIDRIIEILETLPRTY